MPVTPPLRIPYYKPRPDGADSNSTEIDHEDLQRDWFELEYWANRHDHGGGGGAVGWDAIVDLNLAASDPDNHMFLGIGEAIQALSSEGYTSKAYILVKAHKSSNADVDNTYVETASISNAINHVYIVADNPSEAGMGFHDDEGTVVYKSPIWDHNNFSMQAVSWYVYGLEIIGAGSAGGNKTSLFGGAVLASNCVIRPGSMGLSSGRRLMSSSNQAYLHQCQVPEGWFAFSAASDSQFAILAGQGGTYNPCFTTTPGNQFFMSHCRIRVAALSNTTWSIPSTITRISIELEQDFEIEGLGSVLTINPTGGQVQTLVLKSQLTHGTGSGGFLAVNFPSPAWAWIEGQGYGAITVGEPNEFFTTSSTHKNLLDVSMSGALDITGPAVIQVASAGALGWPVTVRGRNVIGHVLTRFGNQSSGTAVSFIDADFCQLQVVSHTLGNSGTFKPYSFDSASDNNLLVWHGMVGYGTVGTDAGTNNIVLPATGGGGFVTGLATLVNESQFGNNSAVGSSTLAAREDHTHDRHDDAVLFYSKINA